MRYRELRSFLRKWQAILGLHAWTIQLLYLGEEHFDNPREHASIECYEEEMLSIIKINKDLKWNQKRTVIHELCHLLLIELQPENPTNDEIRRIEKAVNRLEKALAELAGIPDETPPLWTSQGGD